MDCVGGSIGLCKDQKTLLSHHYDSWTEKGGGGGATEEGRRRSEGGGAYLLHTILLSNITYGQLSRQIYYGLNCPFDMPFNTRYDIQFTYKYKRFIQENLSTV